MEAAQILMINNKINKMQAFFMCWMFDSRWLFSLLNPFLEFILVVPLVINLLTIIGMVYERSVIKIQVESSYIILNTLLIFLCVLCLLLLIRTYQSSEQKLKSNTQNYDAIRNFIHNFQGKKGIWSWIGFCITLLSIIQTAVNNFYISSNSSIYGCYTNFTRLYIDIAAWSYILLVVLLFMILKVAFLIFAWKNPQRYLQFKQIV